MTEFSTTNRVASIDAYEIARNALDFHFPRQIGDDGLPTVPDEHVIALQRRAAMLGDDQTELVAGLTEIITRLAFRVSSRDGRDARKSLADAAGRFAFEPDDLEVTA